MSKSALTAERAREFLAYDPETGALTWRVNKGPRARFGDEAGAKHDERGYRRVRIDGGNYYAHRLVWLIVHGRWPAALIDHVDGNPSNNSIGNLREADKSGNSQNIAATGHGTSPYRGVHWHVGTRKWKARIKVGGRDIHLGVFECELEARDAYLAAKARLHDFQPTPRVA